MTLAQKITGLIATLFLVLVIPIYILIEPSQQREIAVNFRAASVKNATDLYAENCAVCHGAAGEGIAVMPALNSEGVRNMTPQDLLRVVARGRYNTLMEAWAQQEGGVLTDAQVAEMVTFMQQADWAAVEARVAELELTPPEVVQMDVSQEMLAAVSALQDGEVLGSGLMLYAENCSACHGADGSGTTLAPEINSSGLRDKGIDEITRIVNFGVPGTLMASWNNTLEPEQISDVVGLIERWPELELAGVEFPEMELQVFEMTPEMIAEGERLFSIACKACHGAEAYGTRMAPSLNNQIFLNETPDAAIYQIIAGGIPDTAMPAWGSRLIDQDISALVAYLRSFEP